MPEDCCYSAEGLTADQAALVEPLTIGHYAVQLSGDLKDKKIPVIETESLYEVSRELDVLYVTRIQKERIPDPLDYEKVKNVYILTEKLLDHVKPDLKILHPLPRVNEIDPSLDRHPQAEYFQQSKNGVTVRKALLSLVLGVRV